MDVGGSGAAWTRRKSKQRECKAVSGSAHMDVGRRKHEASGFVPTNGYKDVPIRLIHTRVERATFSLGGRRSIHLS